MKIKPNRYYKEYYNETDHSGGYNILYTDTKHVYILSYTRRNVPFYKYNHKVKLVTIKAWQEYINHYFYKIEEISKEDVFLELL